MPRMITIQQAAIETGMSYNAIRQLLLAGKIVHIKAGSKYLINAEKLAAYLNGEDSNETTTNDDDRILDASM